MRIVIFTANPALESTPWWPEVLATPGLRGVLVVRRIPPEGVGAAIARARRNLRKHGPIYIPYRAGVFAGDVVRALWRFVRQLRMRETTAPSRDPRVWTLLTRDLHSPGTIEQVRLWRPDLGISLGAPVLRERVFGIPTMGTLNVHLGRVPDYRGAPPGFWELWNDAQVIGATVHWVDAGLDTGPVVAEASAPIYPHDTLASVEARATDLGLSAFRRALRSVVSGDVTGHRQPDRGGHTNRFPTLRQRWQLAVKLWWRRMRPRLADPGYTAKVMVASAWLFVVAPLVDLIRTLRGRHPVRIFTFHRVTNLRRDGMTVRPDVFRRQVRYLARHYQLVGLNEALDLLAEGTRLDHPVATVTFDDGYRSVIDEALPILERVGVPAASFVCTSLVGTAEHLAHDAAPADESFALMDWREVTRLHQRGWHIGGHTSTHPRLSRLDAASISRELTMPMDELHSHLGNGRPVAMAYPFGGPADITPGGVAAARDAGYAALFSDFGGENFPGDDPFEFKRIDIGGDHDTLMWKAMARGLDLPRWGRVLRPVESA